MTQTPDGVDLHADDSSDSDTDQCPDEVAQHVANDLTQFASDLEHRHDELSQDELEQMAQNLDELVEDVAQLADEADNFITDGQPADCEVDLIGDVVANLTDSVRERVIRVSHQHGYVDFESDGSGMCSVSFHSIPNDVQVTRILDDVAMSTPEPAIRVWFDE